MGFFKKNHKKRIVGDTAMRAKPWDATAKHAANMEALANASFDNQNISSIRSHTAASLNVPSNVTTVGSMEHKIDQQYKKGYITNDERIDEHIYRAAQKMKGN
jgi:hypothetical protein